MSDDPILELHDVSRSFARNAATLDAVSLTIHTGEFVAITGPSGSGKSTLLNIIGLLDRPASGDYLFDGRSTAGLRPRERDRLRSERIGFVFQASHGLPGRSVASNIQVPLALAGVPRPEQFDRIDRALSAVGMTRKANARFELLSGGEKQRMAIARALVSEPDVLLLDEPTGNLDHENTLAVIAMLRRLNRAGVTIVLVTHDQDVAAAAARHIVLADGVATEHRPSGAAPAGSPEIAGAAADPPPMRTSRVTSETASSGRRNRGSISRLLTDALFSMTARPWRTFLTLLTVGVGAAGVTVADGLATTTAQQVDSSIRDASNSVVRARLVQGDEETDFTDDDIAAASALDGVESAGLIWQVPSLRGPVTRTFAEPPRGGHGHVGVIAVTPQAFDVLTVRTTPTGAVSSMSLPGELSDSIVFVGANAAQRLGVAEAGPNQVVWIDNRSFTVGGIVSAASESAPKLRESVIVTKAAAMSLTERLAPAELVARTSPGRSGNVARALPSAISPASPERVQLETTADLRSLRSQVGGDLDRFLLVIVGVLLGLSVIVTASSLTNSAGHRRFEVGLRRALGSSAGQIARLFVAEGVLLGLAGGMVGSALGVSAVVVGAAVQGLTPVVDPVLMAVALAAGTGVGAVSSVIPAVRSSRLDPAQALRD